MTSAIDPEMCVKTGRLLTEWFEYPVHDQEALTQLALKRFDIDPEGFTYGNRFKMEPERAEIQRKVEAFVTARKNRSWAHNMSKQEVAMRMNEATKITTVVKFLDDTTRERTGLELNPLWQIEVLVRSGTLSPKEQITALKELAGYTHSKAPTVSTNTNINVNPEDWLLELAKDDYKVLGTPEAPLPKHYQPREQGAGKLAERASTRRTKEANNLLTFSADDYAEMTAMVDSEWVEIDD